MPPRSTPVTWPGLCSRWLAAPLAATKASWPRQNASLLLETSPSRAASSRCSSQSSPGVTPSRCGPGRAHSQSGSAYASRASPCAGKSRPHTSRPGMSATSPQVRPTLSAASPASPVPLWETCLVDRISLPVMPLAGSPGTGLALILLAVRVTSLRCPNGEWDRPGKRSHWRDWRQCQAGRIREIGWSLIWYGRSFTTRIITSSI